MFSNIYEIVWYDKNKSIVLLICGLSCYNTDTCNQTVTKQWTGY